MARLERVESSPRARSEKRDGDKTKSRTGAERRRATGRRRGKKEGSQREIKAMNDAAAGASWRV